MPVATVIGGAGGGTAAEAGGEGQGGGPSGTGGGYGLRATPAGVYVIKDDGTVRWEPALDLNRVILGGQIVAIVLFLTIRAIARARAAHSRG
jgi:hypothetical protein